MSLGALPSSRLKYLNKAMSLKTYKKYNWEHAGPELGICTAHVEGCQAGPRVVAAASITSLCVVGENSIQIFIWQFQHQPPNG